MLLLNLHNGLKGHMTVFVDEKNFTVDEAASRQSARFIATSSDGASPVLRSKHPARDAGAGGRGGQLAPQLWSWGGMPPNFLHVATRGIGDGLLYKAFHEGCCKVNRNFAVKS